MLMGFSMTQNSIVFALNGKVFSAQKDHPNFSAICKRIAEDQLSMMEDTYDFDSLIELFDIHKGVEASLNVDQDKKVEIRGDTVFFDGKQLPTYFSNKVKTLLEQGQSVEPLRNFFALLQKNPSETSRNCLFEFLDRNNTPITDDGYFIAFKRVRMDFKDIYSGTFDNSPGKTVQIDRNLVDANIHNTCSHGLHVAASSYLNSYASAYESKTILVKVSPEDVVAVPPDYHQTKMRVCKYVVVEDVTKRGHETVSQDMKAIENKSVYSTATKKFQGLAKRVGNTLKFKSSDGREFTAETVLSGVKDGIAKYAKQIGIPDSTLRGWVKRAKTTKTGVKEFFTKDGREFTKNEVLEMIEKSGSVYKAAKENNLSETTLRNWKKKCQ